LQRFSLTLFLLFYLITFIFRFRLARFFFFTIFFSADNMFAAAFITPVRPVTGQITIGNNKASLSFPESRKLFLNGHRIDKTVSRLRHG
jgi:hypothetical protein